MKKLVFQLFIILCLSSSGIFSQGETNNWYFGYNAGLNFSTSPPTALTNGTLYAFEGGATMSDSAGNLLFYTDSYKIWNRQHVLMSGAYNGAGVQTCAQSSLILKKPESANIYFVFTQGASGSSGGTNYATIDMNLDNGLGSQITYFTAISSAGTERLSAARHCNGEDMWVIIHNQNSNVFKSFLLSSAGLNPTPVLSQAGSVISSSVGFIKVSPNGKKLAMTQYFQGLSKCELFDFDNATGIVSNSVLLTDNIIKGYGLEFSPDNTKLYANGLITGKVYQWDLCAGDNNDIINSKDSIPYSITGSAGSMQLAPDNKIYMAFNNSGILGVINNPNIAGTGCNVTVGPSLGNAQSSLGLPNFTNVYYKSHPSIVSSFVGDCNNVSFKVSGCDSFDGNTSFLWQFGDSASGINTSSSIQPLHNFVSPGTYTVKLILTGPCGSDSVSTSIVAGCTHIRKNNENSFLKIYPNPVVDQLTIETEENIKLTIYDAFGILVFNRNFENGKHILPLNLKNGAYLLKAISNSHVVQRTILIDTSEN